jgi:hypothetical protein
LNSIAMVSTEGTADPVPDSGVERTDHA